jgi:hypothetical protein
MVLLFLLIFIIILAGVFEKKWRDGGGTKLVKKPKKYAVITLMMINDSYLPGAVTLAISILLLFKKTKLDIKSEYLTGKLPEKKFDLLCMCDKNVSKDAREVLLKYFDKLIDIEEYIIPPKYNKINLSNNKNKEQIYNTYSRELCKFQMLNLTKYDKIIYTDADSVFFTLEFLDLFKLKTPATTIFSEVSAYGIRIKKSIYESSTEKRERSVNEDFTETTLMVVTPKKGDYEKIIKFAENNKEKCSLDAFCVDNYFNKVYMIDKKYLSRYAEENTIILDVHGSDFKPWFKKAEYYIDTWYIWAAIYNTIYRCFLRNIGNLILDEAFEKTFNIQRYEWPEDYKVVNIFFIKKKIDWYKLVKDKFPKRIRATVRYRK